MKRYSNLTGRTDPVISFRPPFVNFYGKAEIICKILCNFVAETDMRYETND